MPDFECFLKNKDCRQVKADDEKEAREAFVGWLIDNLTETDVVANNLDQEF